MDRPECLDRLIKAIRQQTNLSSTIVVVDNGSNQETLTAAKSDPDIVYLKSRRNLGGAGGFVYGIMHALALGASRIWIMDDDGCPQADNCLEVLNSAIDSDGYDMVSPLVVDIADESKLAFFYYRDGRPIKSRAELRTDERFDQFAHLFNGALIRADTFERFGLPRYELFFRGDEVDFMFRLRRGGARFATLSTTAFLHPSGAMDTHPIMGGRYHAVIPSNDFARFYYHRNRGNLFREFGLSRAFLYDLVRYAWFFLITRSGDFRGLMAWAKSVWLGYSRCFTPFVRSVAETRPIPVSASCDESVSDWNQDDTVKPGAISCRTSLSTSSSA